MNHVNVIGRNELIGVAKRALEIAEVDPQSSLHHEVMNVAHTAERLHTDWRAPTRDCGCLIGTYRARMGEWPCPPYGSKEYRVGLAFVTALAELRRGEEVEVLTFYAVASDPIQEPPV